jgi:hypothetical protein
MQPVPGARGTPAIHVHTVQAHRKGLGVDARLPRRRGASVLQVLANLRLPATRRVGGEGRKTALRLARVPARDGPGAEGALPLAVQGRGVGSLSLEGLENLDRGLGREVLLLLAGCKPWQRRMMGGEQGGGA